MDQCGRERWLMINRQVYETSNRGSAPLFPAPADRWQRASCLAHPGGACSPSSEDLADARWPGRGAELSQSCHRAVGSSRDLAPRARDLGPAAAGRRGGRALPRLTLPRSESSLAETAARQMIRRRTLQHSGWSSEGAVPGRGSRSFARSRVGASRPFFSSGKASAVGR